MKVRRPERFPSEGPKRSWAAIRAEAARRSARPFPAPGLRSGTQVRRVKNLLNDLARLIASRTENPGGDEATLARLLEKQLEALGADEIVVEHVPREGRAAGANVFARFGAPTLLVNAHLDTVPANTGWTGDPLCARIDGDRVIGLGAADTKGAIAAMLGALAVAPPKDTAILFSGDEEHGGACMKAFLAGPRAKGLERAIVCEPTGCRIGSRHRGILAFEARVTGEGGHSSKADGMRAPIADLARIAVAIDDWGRARRDVGPDGFKGFCVNVAALDGGVAFNVVPSRASLSISVRPPPETDSHAVREELFALCRAVVPDVALVAVVDNASFRTRDLERFRPLLGDVVSQPVSLAFWTEAAMLGALGIDAVVFGPGDIAQAHAPDEWVAVAQLESARAAFERVFRATWEAANGAR